MKTKYKPYEFLYLLGYALFIISYLSFNDIRFSPKALWFLCPPIAFLIFLSFLIARKYTLKQLLFRSIVVILFCIAAYITNKAVLVVYGALICASGNISFKKIVVTSMVTSCIMIILSELLSKLGITQYREFFRPDGTQARSFGFGYYHVVPYMYYHLVLEYLYIKKKKVSWIELFIILIINYAIYKLTTLRLTYYMNYITVALYIILVKFNFIDLRRKAYRALSILVFPVAFGFTFWVNYYYSPANNLLWRLNYILSNRLSLANEGFQRYGIKLFGNFIETSGGDWDTYFYIDSGYIYSLLGYGLLFSILVIFIYMCLCNYSAKENDKRLFVWLVGVAIFNFSNGSLVGAHMNPVILLFPFVFEEFNKLFHKKIIYNRRRVSSREIVLNGRSSIK